MTRFPPARLDAVAQCARTSCWPSEHVHESVKHKQRPRCSRRWRWMVRGRRVASPTATCGLPNRSQPPCGTARPCCHLLRRRDGPMAPTSALLYGQSVPCRRSRTRHRRASDRRGRAHGRVLGQGEEAMGNTLTSLSTFVCCSPCARLWVSYREVDCSYLWPRAGTMWRNGV